MTLRQSVYILTESEPHDDWPGERVIGACASLDGAQDRARRSMKMTSQPFGVWQETVPGREWQRVVGTDGAYQAIKLYPLER